MDPIIGYSALATLNFLVVRQTAFRKAKELAGAKGIVNIGSGCDRNMIAQAICSDPQVAENLDLRGGGPSFSVVDLETGRLGFSDRQFGCVFASHVLEHLENWEAALEEWVRVADHVVVVVPHPLSVSGYLSLAHKQFFSFGDKRSIEARWPTVTVYM